MCLIFISLQQHPTYKLIIAANRDEFYQRKTAAAAHWSDFPSIIGGRDLEAGGTWMGITTSGRISMLTNYRDPANINPAAPSRGHLVSHFLEGTMSGQDYVRAIQPGAKDYNGFNLVVGSVDELWYISNYKDGFEKLTKGLHGLSNHLLDTPWPKVVRGKEKMKLILDQKDITTEQLFEFLYDDKQASDRLLPDTGIGLDRERALSSMFIKTNNYGSRCSTVMLVDNNNHIKFAERVYDLKTFAFTTTTFEI